MADATSNKELAWSLTMDDADFEKTMKKNGLLIKDFDAQLKAVTKTALSMQKALTDMKIPDLPSVSKTSTVQKTSIIKDDGSIASLTKQAKQLKLELSRLSEEERENSAEAKAMAINYANIQAKIKVFNDSLKTTEKAVKTVEIGTLEKQFANLGINIRTLSKEQLNAIKITKAQATALNSNVNSYNKQAASLNLNNKIIRVLNAEQLKSVKIGGKLTAEIKRQDAALKEFDATTGRFQRSVGNYQNSLLAVANKLKFVNKEGKVTFGSLTKGFGNITKSGAAFGAAMLGVGGAIVALQTLTRLAKEAALGLAEFSDQAANVQKVTGQTNSEFSRMAENLKKLDTRTALKDLLAITAAGGRFQVAEDELVDFTKTVDTVIVGLSSDLSDSSEDIALNLAKISDSFRGLNDNSIAGGVKAVGSAINELAQRTKAQAQPILDYTKGMIGLSKSLELAPDKVLALATTFNIAGIEASVAQTATSQLLVTMGKKTEEAAKIAGYAIKDFSKILKEDPIEAMNLFARGLTGTGSNVETIAEDLKGFGLQGKKVVSVLLALGKNQKTYAKNIEIARRELETSNSITQEAAIMNKTAGAELDKLGKLFANTFKNLENSEALGSFIRVLREELPAAISGVANLIKGAWTIAINTLTLGLINVNGASETLLTTLKLVSGISFLQLVGEIQNLTIETNKLSSGAKIVKKIFDTIAGKELAESLEESKKQLEAVRKSIALDAGFENWKLYQEHIKKVADNAKEAKAQLEGLKSDFDNVRIPEMDFDITPENIKKFDNQIKRLANLKTLLAQKTKDLINLDTSSGKTDEDIQKAVEAENRTAEALNALRERVAQYRREQAKKAAEDIIKTEIATFEEGLKTKEEKEIESWDKTESLLEEALKRELITKEKYNNLMLALDDKAREAERAAEEKAAEEREKIRIAAVEKYKDTGLSRIDILNRDYQLELEALQKLEEDKIALSQSYNDIRYALEVEHKAAIKELEDTEAEERLAKIEEENQLLLDTTQMAVGGVADAFKQLAIEGASAEEVFKNLAKSAAGAVVDIIASMVSLQVKNAIIGALEAKAAIATGTATASALTAAYTTPATLATIASFGASAAAAPGAIAAALAATSGIVGGASGISGSGNMSFGQFTNTGGLAGLVTGGGKNASGPTTGDLLGQMQVNAYNAETTGSTPINVNITSSDPNTEVSISYAKGQNSLVSSGYNVEEIN